MEQIKKAFKDAKKDLKEEKIKQFKEVILKTLNLLEKKQKTQRDIVKEIQILKADIKDFKEGRLDRIQERQAKDKRASEISVVQIKKGKIVEGSKYWQQPYDWSNGGTGTWTTGFCSNNTSGTYVLESGNIKYI